MEFGWQHTTYGKTATSGGRDAWLPRIAWGLCLLCLMGCSPQRNYESLLVLADVVAVDAPSRLKETTPPPVRRTISFVVEGRARSGDLYLPGTGKPLAGIVLVPGAVPHAKDDARLVAFATMLARARFAVLTPEMEGFRELRIQPGDARAVADAFRYLASRPDLAPDGRAGIAAFSYAVGPSLLAAMQPDIRERVRFVAGVGGYYDLARTVGYFSTGYFRHESRWYYLRPDDFGKMVFVKSSKPHLRDPRDRAILDEMVEMKLRDRDANIAPLAAGLGEEGRAVYALLTNTDPERTPQLIAALPPRVQADLDALTLRGKDLRQLKARLLLVHGENDNLIPFPESVELAANVAPGQARLFIIRRILGHVDLTLAHVFSREFMVEELPDAWRMWRAVDALLAERAGDER
jgi:pimeloyl-ACP methyl ester carboxylesterase